MDRLEVLLDARFRLAAETALAWVFLRFRDRLAPLDSVPGWGVNLIRLAFAVLAMDRLEVLLDARFRLAAETALAWVFLRFRDRLAPLDSVPGWGVNLIRLAFAVLAMDRLEVLLDARFRLAAETALAWVFLCFRVRLASLDSVPGWGADLRRLALAVLAMDRLEISFFHATVGVDPCARWKYLVSSSHVWRIRNVYYRWTVVQEGAQPGRIGSPFW